MGSFSFLLSFWISKLHTKFLEKEKNAGSPKRVTHAELPPFTPTALPPAARTSLGGPGLPRVWAPPAASGSSGRAGECGQASGGLRADRMVSCGPASRTLGAVGQLGPAAQPHAVSSRPRPRPRPRGQRGWRLGWREAQPALACSVRGLWPQRGSPRLPPQMGSLLGCPITSQPCPPSEEERVIRASR